MATDRPSAPTHELKHRVPSQERRQHSPLASQQVELFCNVTPYITALILSKFAILGRDAFILHAHPMTYGNPDRLPDSAWQAATPAADPAPTTSCSSRPCMHDQNLTTVLDVDQLDD